MTTPSTRSAGQARGSGGHQGRAPGQWGLRSRNNIAALKGDIGLPQPLTLTESRASEELVVRIV